MLSKPAGAGGSARTARASGGASAGLGGGPARVAARGTAHSHRLRPSQDPQPTPETSARSRAGAPASAPWRSRSSHTPHPVPPNAVAVSRRGVPRQPMRIPHRLRTGTAHRAPHTSRWREKTWSRSIRSPPRSRVRESFGGEGKRGNQGSVTGTFVAVATTPRAETAAPGGGVSQGLRLIR